MTTPTPLATFNVHYQAPNVAPPGIPAAVWPHIFGAAATAKATGSVGARTADPATGREYRIEFRKAAGANNVVRTTPVADVFTVPPPPPPPETAVEHLFQPIVTMRRRPDGRWDMAVDWSDSYLYGVDVRPGSDCQPIHETDAPASAAACAALDAWTQTMVKTCIVPAVEHQGITRVECVGCGAVVFDPTGIELWNGYGAGPCGCEPETTASRWTFLDGTVRTILDGRDVPNANH